MKLENLKNKHILILGFGLEGKSIYNFLKYYFPEKEIGIADQKDGEDYLEKQKDYDLVIKSPGIPKEKVTIPYATATNIFFANAKGMIIGITGSKGKSTTASLIYSIVKQAGKSAHLVGNITHKLAVIGQPMLSGLLQSNNADDIWVCELSSFMLDDIQYSPRISVITSFFPEHMDYHGTVENYFLAKTNIVKFAKPTDYFIYNQKFPSLQELAEKTSARTIPFVETIPFSKENFPLQGQHNIDNIKAAITVAEVLQIPEQHIILAIKNFTPLPHRLENIGTYHHITFYDDAIATTPEATIQAMNTLQNIGTIFLGGQDRGYNFTQLAKLIANSSIQNLVLFPESGEKIYKEIRKVTQRHFQLLSTMNMQEAVTFAYKHTPQGTICLLSTASPGYTVWKNFEEKGNEFKKFVKQLAK